jgi:HPt (histidine-containing phosphotransfer) domain-containing protein
MDKPRPIEKYSTQETGVISLAVLEGLRKFQQTGEPDFVTELIDLFLNDTAVQLESLGVAVSNNNVPEVRRLAHLVKGSSGNIGAGGMAELCQEMETLEGTSTTEQALLAKLEEEFLNVADAFKAQRQEEVSRRQ